MPRTVYITIFETLQGDEYFVEYRPDFDVLAGAIEILSIQHTKRPVTWQEQREQYQATPIQRPPRQMGLFDD